MHDWQAMAKARLLRSGLLPCRQRRLSGLVMALIMALMVALPGWAAEPDSEGYKTELGIGVGVLQFPAYRGSDQRTTWVVPVPYLVYRGDFFKADRQGLRGTFFDSDRVEFSLSASASPPTRSDGIVRRQGMPDLKPSVELGPQLNVLLSHPDNKAYSLRLRLPVRQGITVESRPRNAGLTFSPNLNLDISNPWGLPGGNPGFVVGPIFNNQKQNDYFYSVDAPYATATRPAYRARSGYAGTQFLVSLSRKMGDVWVGSYLRYDNLAGATFIDSPLVAQRSYFTAGVAVTYVFAKF